MKSREVLTKANSIGVLAATLAMTGLLQAAPVMDATKNDGVLSTVRKNPGDPVTYTDTISNTSATDPALNVVYTSPDDVNAPTNGATVNATAVAVDDVYGATVLANVGINTAASSGFNVLANDFLGVVNGVATLPADMVLTCDTASTGGGTVNMVLSGAGVGTFSYTPAPGFTGVDTFNYVLSSANGTTLNKTGKVTLTVGGPVIWFVNNAAGAGDGRLATPFNTLAAFQAVNNGTGNNPKANHYIFLYESATSYSGPVTLLSGQQLIGQDSNATLASIAAASASADSAALPGMNSGNPVVTKVVTSGAAANAVNLTSAGTNYVVRGLTIGNTTSSGIAGNNFGILTVADLAFDDTATRTGTALNLTTGTINGTINLLEASAAVNGIALTTVNTALAISAGTLSNLSGADLLINGGSGTFSYAGAISNTAGRSVDISNRTGNTITLSGNISDTGTGVSLATNTGATINLTGQLTLSTGANNAFSATGGGTVNVTHNNNTIVSTTGVGVNMANTTIGASGVKFKSVAVNGASNGIVLNNTGSGAFTITGDAVNALGGNASGGTIQNITGHGILLINAQNVSLTNVTLQGTQGSGINGIGVNNFVFANGTINNSGDALGESNMSFTNNGVGTGNNLSGVVSVTNSVLTNAFDCGIDTSSDNGTIFNLTITGNTITSTTSTATSKGYGIRIYGIGSSGTVANLTKATIHGNDIQHFPSAGGIQVQYGNTNAAGPGAICGTPGDVTNVVAITNNLSRGTSAANRMGTSAILVSANGGNGASRSVANFNISNNGTVMHPVGNCLGTAIGVGNNGFATMTATVNNNVIVANNTVGSNGIGGGNGIVLASTETPDLTLTANGNNISQVDGNGILLVGRGVTGTAKLKITNNTVAAPLAGVRQGIRVDAGNGSSVDDAVYLEISGNTSAGIGAGAMGIGLRKQGTVATTNDFAVRGMSATATPNIETYINSQNPAGGGTLLISATSGFSNWTGSGGQPGFNPLMLAQGGVEAAIAAPALAELEVPAEVAPSAPSTNDMVREVPAPKVLGVGDLTTDQLDTTVAAAIQLWKAAGADEKQLAALAAMRFEIADLPAMRLGEQGEGLIRVDRRAGGNGWFVDGQPGEHSEFNGASTRLYTTPEQAPAGRMDLLTAVLHEMGHALGLEDSYRNEDRDSVMYGYLTKGERRLPALNQARDAVPHDHKGGHFLTSAINIGTLPPGKSVTITSTVTISPSINVGTISSQGTVSGSNFASVLSDDSELLGTGTKDPTVTLIGIPPVITSGNTATFKVGTAGSFSVTASGIPAPTFSTISALPSGVTLAGNGTLSGTPATGTGGVYNLVIKAANTVAPDASQNFTLTVNEAPTITSAAATSFTTDTLGTFTVTTGTSFPANAALSVSGTLPVGVTFTDNGNGTATLTGTPAANAGGIYPLTITANNGITPNGSQNFTLTVNQAPAITSANSATFTVGSAGTFTVTTTGFPIAAITKTGALPGGVTLVDNGNGTATLAGTPTAGQGGIYAISIDANNGVGSQATQSFTLTVNQAPAITSANSTTFTVGSAGSFTVTTTGFPSGATMTIGADGALPSGVSFIDNGNGTATLSGTPVAATGGTYPLTITANNGVAPNASQSFTLTVNQAPAITSSNSVAFTATQAGTFTVTTTGFPTNASMAIAATGSLPGGVTFIDNGDGTATLAGTPGAATAGTYPLTITANNGVGVQASQNFTLSVQPPVHHFTVSAPANATAGTAVSVTVTARNQDESVVTDYIGTVHFASSDAQVTLPSDSTLTNGVGAFNVTFKTAGNQTVTVNDSIAITATGTSSPTLVVADVAATFTVVAPANATAGTPLNAEVTARDAFNNVATSYAGSVQVTSSDAQATLPASGTLTNGVGNFSIILKTAGTQTVSATDTVTASITGISNNVAVAAGAATHFAVSAPVSATAGSAFNVTVTAQDAFDNTAAGYAGTVHFTSSDAAAVLAGDGVLVNGVGTFSTTLKTAGSQTITATDTVTAAITGVSNSVTVNAAAATHLLVTAPANAIAGTPVSVSVTAKDAFENTDPNYAGTVAITSSDAVATLPSSGTLTSGVGNFDVTLKTGANQTVTATDTATASITGISGQILVDPRADLVVTCSDTPDPVNAGSNLTYTIDLSNAGPSAANSVSLSDVLPAGTTFVSLSVPAGWTPSTPAVGASGTVTVTKPTVASAENASFTLVVAVDPNAANGTVITNTAAATSTTTDLNAGNDSATATTTVSTSADLALTLTDSPDPVTAGTNLTYTVTLLNNGPSAAQNVNVSDTLPAGVTFVSATTPAGWSPTTPAVGDDGSVSFTHPSFVAGGNAVFTIVVNVNSSVSAGAVVSNTATVSAMTADATPGNNSSTATTTVSRSADLALQMTGTPHPQVNATTNLTYNVTLTNHGPSDADGVSVIGSIPANTTFVSASVPTGWGVVTPAVGGTGPVSFTHPAVPSGTVANFTLVVNVNANAPDMSVLSNTMTTSSATTDPAPANNLANVLTTVRSGADLAITASALPTPDVVAGTSVTYTVDVVNNGPLVSDNVTMANTLPVGMTFVSATAPAGWSLTTPAVGGTGNVTATNPQLALGATAQFIIVANVDANVAAGTVISNSYAIGSAVTVDVNPGNNSQIVNSNVIAEADLALAMTADPLIAPVESNVTYTLALANNGPSNAANVQVSHPLPAEMTFVSATVPAGWSATTPPVDAGGTVTFTNASFAHNGNAVFTVVAKVKTGTANGTSVVQTSTASTSSTDTNPPNNAAVATVQVGTETPSFLQVGTTAVYNRQNGMGELKVTVTNTTPNPIYGFRLNVDFSAYAGAFPTLRLHNASGDVNTTTPYINYPYQMAVDDAVTLTLQFKTQNRVYPDPFTPVITTEILNASQLPHTNGGGVQPVIKITPNGPLVEFPSVAGHWYRVSYSHDMTNWYDSPVPVKAGGTKTQWLDSGAPFTMSPPLTPEVPTRIYRVNEIAAP